MVPQMGLPDMQIRTNQRTKRRTSQMVPQMGLPDGVYPVASCQGSATGCTLCGIYCGASKRGRGHYHNR